MLLYMNNIGDIKMGCSGKPKKKSPPKTKKKSK
jgi:hypothetical protein